VIPCHHCQRLRLPSELKAGHRDHLVCVSRKPCERVALRLNLERFAVLRQERAELSGAQDRDAVSVHSI